ncbi:MAG: 23S rRNA (uracil(1939)-C(5))-methyltransferase RlmD [Rubricoccaceae bacterium]|nr:23S rRNA (uracil(1939)-C(5))-methyltransferase RlmD [Rubricoccaceae bacterium]
MTHSPTNTNPAVKKGAELELTLEKFADRGKSLVKVAGYVVFVAGAVPGDRVRAKVFKRRRSFAEARLIEVLEPSSLRTEARCEYFSDCGGCKWQHVRYDVQLEMKRQAVADALTHQGGMNLDELGIEVNPTLGADEVYFYRNKMEFSFSAGRWLTQWEIDSGNEFDKDFALGLHVPGRFDKVLDLQACYLQSEWSARLVNSVRAFAKNQGWEPWDVRKHTGYLRHLVIRTPAYTGEKMVVLVTSREEQDRIRSFADFLQSEFSDVTTFVNTINSTPAQTAFGERMITVYGPGVVHDRLGPYTFEIAPNAFFQTNTKQAEKLYEVVAEFADFRQSDLVYDLYCGAGTISIFISNHVKRVVGVELIDEAVANAKTNASANNVENCTFVAGDMLKLFTPEFVDERGRPDVVIVDPPRAGMHPKVVKQIARLKPERLVYVSCNPQTQARDIAQLKEAYRVQAVQPVDLFPHTHHVECVIKLVAQ